MEKITKKNSILYNQLWINKAIEEGYIEFLPIHKFSNKSIGEHIEIKYNQLYNEEFDKNFYNGTIEEFQHRLPNQTPKINFENSLLLKEILINVFMEQGMYQEKANKEYKKLLKSIKILLETLKIKKEDIEYISLIEDNSFELTIEGFNRKKMRK